MSQETLLIPTPEVAENTEPEAVPDLQSETQEVDVIDINRGEVLKQFCDEILQGPLPVEIAGKVDSLRQNKNHQSQQQQERLAGLTAELTEGTMSRWVVKSEIKSPPILEEQAEEIKLKISASLENYLQTDQGKKDSHIRMLREFAANPTPSKEDVQEVSKLLGVGNSNGIHKLLPPKLRKQDTQLLGSVTAELDRLAPGTGWNEEKLSQDQVSAHEAGAAESELGPAIRIPQAVFREKINSIKHIPNIDSLKEGITELDGIWEDRWEEIASIISSNPAILSGLARGSISTEQLVESLKAQEQYSVSSHGISGFLKRTVGEELEQIRNRLPEPSLAGISIGRIEKQGVEDSLDKLIELAGVAGQSLPNKKEEMSRIDKAVERAQQLFFEKVDDPNNLYWHFTSNGLKLIQSGELQSGDMTEIRNTGGHSKGVHFVKPGLGIDTQINYPGYAKQTITMGSKEHLESPFGMAAIYKLKDIVETTPMRDEPIERHHKAAVSEDVTFRPESKESEYAYDLKDAYLLPFVTSEQLRVLRETGEFDEIFGVEGWQPSVGLADKIARTVLRKAGYDKQWIESHLLPAELVDDETREIGIPKPGMQKKLFGTVAKYIHAKDSPERGLIVPLKAEKGSFENHDNHNGTGTEVWMEELVELEPAK